MHPLKLIKVMAVHASTEKEEDMPQAQALQYDVEASARHCPATPVSLNAVSNTGNLSCNNRVATGANQPDGILPHKS